VRITLPAPSQRVARTVWRDGAAAKQANERAIPEETAIAFTYGGSSYAVMMATPRDLEDFAVGFTLTEGVAASESEIENLDIVPEASGIELRMRLVKPRERAYSDRRRHLAGPTGCGLCGIESLTEAVRELPKVSARDMFTPEEIMRAVASLPAAQSLNNETRAVHAAAFWKRGQGLVALREDVGRHNALDKLAGALARSAVSPEEGILVVTSRVSVEMIQKAAMIGAPLIVAVSAPTALALRTADQAGICVIAIARNDGFEVFTHPERIVMEAPEEAANVAYGA
jgi:FdhD protein